MPPRRPIVEELAPCVNSLIVKDCVIEPGLRTCVYGSVGKDVLVVPGTGLVDFASIVKTLHGAGFRGPIMVEKQPGDTPEAIGANFVAARRFVDDLLRSASGARRPGEHAPATTAQAALCDAAWALVEAPLREMAAKLDEADAAASAPAESVDAPVAEGNEGEAAAAIEAAGDSQASGRPIGTTPAGGVPKE